ncbi:phosphoenolpyruvate carboxykinase [Holotrichia oblita]|nr:phosphoenolpyruvate carboxykinase [Holotrichia oblita]
MTTNNVVLNWLDEMKALTRPAEVVWIDGSKEQLSALRNEAVANGELIELNQEKLPGCYLHRTAVNDVARVEDRTFICTTDKADTGNINNWMAPVDMYAKLNKLYDGSMEGRTMYVIPYMMGPLNSPFSKIGIELTDSIYVVLNMDIMTRIGKPVIDQLGDSDDFVKCLHAKKDVNPEERYIVHFPEDNTIMSINSAYGGNVLLGKKCFALRIASYMGKKEGWMAEHMLILGLTNPKGETKYVSAAFPSACGKTNLAMLVPPEVLGDYKVTTVGDDIAWLVLAMMEGFMQLIQKQDSLVLLLEQVQRLIQMHDGTVWWEGMDGEVPSHGIDWQGNEWTPDSGVKGAHPNSRFTAPARQCPCISDRVLNWIIERCSDEAEAVDSPIGYLPKAEDINIEGLNITLDTVKELLSVDKSVWLEDVANIKEFFAKVGERLPKEIEEELVKLEERLK